MCIEYQMFEIVFSMNVKDNNIYIYVYVILDFPVLQCFVNQNVHVYINSKHGSFLYLK